MNDGFSELTNTSLSQWLAGIFFIIIRKKEQVKNMFNVANILKV